MDKEKQLYPETSFPAQSLLVNTLLKQGLFVIISVFCLLYCKRTNAQSLTVKGRAITKINSEWLFTKDSSQGKGSSKSDWQPVNLPHTWNVSDVMDDVPDYYRGVGWYKKTIVVPLSYQSKKISLYFE